LVKYIHRHAKVITVRKAIATTFYRAKLSDP
jgi:hypothetical protein